MVDDVMFLAYKLREKQVFAKNNIEIEQYKMSEMDALMATVKLAKKLK